MHIYIMCMVRYVYICTSKLSVQRSATWQVQGYNLARRRERMILLALGLTRVQGILIIRMMNILSPTASKG